MNLTKIGVLTGVAATVCGGFFWLHPYLPASVTAVAAEQGYLAADAKQRDEREQGDLRVQLKLLNLTIKVLRDKQERDGRLSPEDQDELDLALEQRKVILKRLKDVIG